MWKPTQSRSTQAATPKAHTAGRSPKSAAKRPPTARPRPPRTDGAQAGVDPHATSTPGRVPSQDYIDMLGTLLAMLYQMDADSATKSARRVLTVVPPLPPTVQRALLDFARTAADLLETQTAPPSGAGEAKQ